MDIKTILTNKAYRPVYAGVVFLVMIVGAPIIRGPRNFNMNIYRLLKVATGAGTDQAEALTIILWALLIASAAVVLLAVPAVRKIVEEKLAGKIQTISCWVLIVSVLSLFLTYRDLAMGWGIWLSTIAALLLMAHMIMTRKKRKAE